jgi:hypothetical protein
MPKASSSSPLVAAAALLDQQLREYDDLASEAKKIQLDDEKALGRVARVLESSTTRQPAIQEALRTLVSEIDAARLRQQQSLDTLVEVSRALEARAFQFDALMKRFAALGESAHTVNQLTTEISAQQGEGVPESKVLDGLRELEQHMGRVVEGAEDLARDAEQNGWTELARQADAVRQQVRAAKNKLSLAQRTVAARAPS